MITCKICNYTHENTILSHVRTVHKITSKEYRLRFGCGCRVSWCNYLSKEERDRCYRKTVEASILSRKINGRKKIDKWSRKHDCCVVCGTKDKIHAGHGKCHDCLRSEQIRWKTAQRNKKIKENGIDGQDYVTCKICGNPYQNITSHLVRHKLTFAEYCNRYSITQKAIPKNISNKLGSGVSIGRKRLLKERGYLNPKSQRDKKRAELVRKHSKGDYSKVSQLEDRFAMTLSKAGYSVVGCDYIGYIDENTIMRQYNINDKFCVDFYMPLENLVIEVLGDFWHGWGFHSGNKKYDELHGNIKKYIYLDGIRFKYLEDNNIKFLKLWEHDLDDEVINASNIKEIIKKELKI